MRGLAACGRRRRGRSRRRLRLGRHRRGRSRCRRRVRGGRSSRCRRRVRGGRLRMGRQRRRLGRGRRLRVMCRLRRRRGGVRGRRRRRRRRPDVARGRPYDVRGRRALALREQDDRRCGRQPHPGDRCQYERPAPALPVLERGGWRGLGRRGRNTDRLGRGRRRARAPGLGRRPRRFGRRPGREWRRRQGRQPIAQRRVDEDELRADRVVGCSRRFGNDRRWCGLRHRQSERCGGIGSQRHSAPTRWLARLLVSPARSLPRKKPPGAGALSSTPPTGPFALSRARVARWDLDLLALRARREPQTIPAAWPRASAACDEIAHVAARAEATRYDRP